MSIKGTFHLRSEIFYTTTRRPAKDSKYLIFYHLRVDAQENDAFISRASEDKSTIARDLAQYLVSYKLKVWYDEFTFEIGDSL